MKGCPNCGVRFQEGATSCPYDGAQLRDLPDPLVGLRLAGRYQIGERVGFGGMGAVYRAIDETRAREVAVKFLAQRLSRDPEYRKRFSREVRVASRIEHEHIVETTDFGELDNGQLFLVMEFLGGETLCEAMMDGALPVHRVLTITHQIARALARAHELDVVHRDIKPENVHLLSGYQGDFVKLLDFGLAQMLGEARLTATGTVFGTPEYLSPEQASGREVTGAADLYSLGCVMFEMLTGDVPFDGQASDLVLHHMRTPPPHIRERNPELPRDLDAVVWRLMAKEPAERPSSAYALAGEIERLLRDEGSFSAPVRLAEASATVVGAPFAIEDAWAERIRMFSTAFSRDGGPAGAEPWVNAAVEQLSHNVEAMRQLRERMNQLSELVAQRERSIRELRLRFGRAIDELGHDSIRIEREVANLNAREDEGRGKRRDVEDVLRGRIRDLGTVAFGVALSSRLLEEIAAIGHLAEDCLRLQQGAPDFSARREQLLRERSDLDFQLEQLKGRLGSLNAEAEQEVEGVRREIDALDREIAQHVEQLSAKAGPVYAHMMKFPELKDELKGGSGSFPTMLGGSFPTAAGGGQHER